MHLQDENLSPEYEIPLKRRKSLIQQTNRKHFETAKMITCGGISTSKMEHLLNYIKVPGEVAVGKHIYYIRQRNMVSRNVYQSH